jgi:hypothetical protein
MYLPIWKDKYMVLNTIHGGDRTADVQQDTTREVSEQSEETEVVSVWETSRRRSRHNRHTAAQARAQGKRRQLRRLWGRSR